MKKKFINKYNMNFKMYKEYVFNSTAEKDIFKIIYFLFLIAFIWYFFSKAYSTLITYALMFLIIRILNFISIRTKYSMLKKVNKKDEFETIVDINDEAICFSLEKNKTDYDFSQVSKIIETKNLIIINMNPKGSIVLNKNNMKEDEKEKLLKHLFSVCQNFSKKEVINSKKWVLIRKVCWYTYIILALISLILCLVN